MGPRSAFSSPGPWPGAMTDEHSVRPHVLLVDDDPAVARGVARLLQRHVRVVVEHGAAEALKRIREGERFDAVLSDVDMPVMNGLAFFERLAAEAPDVCRRFAFLTGGAADDERLTAAQRPCLLKPCSPTQLFELVRALVQGGSSSPAG